ncbi:5-formyltetrahydrofolate cyclo-ligase [Mycoplasma bradburyae]|uniref:5-formyltetrahydrofolate cyclo-ligase n=1 Tax=Mycoplasma bradburyae TaxID=2963128 RepID=UPI002341FDE8|nr:5-formyltetrahydrofolate cyclo-ligase [Mycoplasma bradburyae]MDC4182764.1 5-formyltetrahydrofolate cyclo-ligase [Mycoplasma bradburyae]MDC4184445.1 5-formyltetrahydrofolate cyclo-ligase [Mycoplasma bradburyae]
MSKNKNQLIRKELIDQAIAFAKTNDKKIIDESLTKIVFEYIKSNNFKKIGLYSSLIYEFDTTQLIQKLIDDNYQVFLPRVNDDNTIDFYQIESLDFSFDLKYKIKQPINSINKLDNNLDLFIIPLVGYNSRKIRLGHGKGCYDRFFNNLKYKGYKVCVAYDFMLNDQFDTHQYDVKIDYIFNINNL